MKSPRASTSSHILVLQLRCGSTLGGGTGDCSSSFTGKILPLPKTSTNLSRSSGKFFLSLSLVPLAVSLSYVPLLTHNTRLKALAAFNPKSPVYDPDRWTYDLLPTVSRWLIFRLIPARLFPRLHHANIELRTTYLDTMILKEIAANMNKRIRLISLGGGYDVRSVRLLTSGQVDEAWELDIPSVVESKCIMLERLQRRRQRLNQTTILPTCRSVDLNNLIQVQEILQDILIEKSSSSSSASSSEQEWHTIFVSEGVLIYLDPTVPGKLLKLCAETVTTATPTSGGDATASLCLADRLENSPGGEELAGRQELARASWSLIDWEPKPGLARHMAVARLFPSSL
jgi:hypothetical protein